MLPMVERSAPAKISVQHIVCFANLMDWKTIGASNFLWLEHRDEALSSYGAEYYLRLLRLVLQLGFQDATQRNIVAFLSWFPVGGYTLRQAASADSWQSAEGSFSKFSAVSVHFDNYLALEAGEVLMVNQEQLAERDAKTFSSQAQIQPTLFEASHELHWRNRLLSLFLKTRLCRDGEEITQAAPGGRIVHVHVRFIERWQ